MILVLVFNSVSFGFITKYAGIGCQKMCCNYWFLNRNLTYFVHFFIFIFKWCSTCLNLNTTSQLLYNVNWAFTALLKQMFYIGSSSVVWLTKGEHWRLRMWENRIKNLVSSKFRYLYTNKRSKNNSTFIFYYKQLLAGYESIICVDDFRPNWGLEPGPPLRSSTLFIPFSKI